MPPRDDRFVVGYLRCSTEEQSREGLGLASQESRIRAHCVAQGLILADLYTDAGVSGKTLDRPQLSALLSRVRAGEVGTVVVLRLDRLTRRTRDLLELVDGQFARHGVELVSLSEQLDTRTPAGRLMLTLLGALAQMEREIIADRTKAALAVKRERGERLGGEPLGLRAARPGDALEPLESELGPVRLILAKRAAGESYRAIATELKTAGVPTKQGGEWRSETVRKIWMRRELYERVLAMSPHRPHILAE
jgi:DNA invertase Pin-like site-specific DNA recombinase